MTDLDPETISDLCASFQQAIIDVLVTKTVAAAKTAMVPLVTVSGGVSGNEALRNQLANACQRAGLAFQCAPPRLCTDNAAMIAFAATHRLQKRASSSVTEEIDPNLALTSNDASPSR